MASLADYLGPTQQQPGAVPAAQREGLRSRWDNFLSNPDTRAALMQFGVSMLSPITGGETFASHFGRAVGSAGEAVGRRQTQRAEQATDLLNRKLTLARLGLDMEESTEQRDLRRQALGLEDERIDIAREGLGIDKMQAETARANVNRERGAATGNAILTAASKAHERYNDVTFEPPINPATGQPMSEEEYVRDQVEKDMKLVPPAPASPFAPSPDEIMPGDLIAKPAADMSVVPTDVLTPPEPNGTVTVVPEATPAPAAAAPRPGPVGANQWKLRNATTWEMIKAGLRAPEEAKRSLAIRALEVAKRQVADPENLNPDEAAPLVLPPPAGPVPTPLVPTPVPTVPITAPVVAPPVSVLPQTAPQAGRRPKKR